MNKKGVLIVLSGFSGAGKGTIVKKLLSTYDNYALSISMTTRNPRPGEEHGREYFFVEREVFEDHIAKDELVEYAQYVGNYYGTWHELACLLDEQVCIVSCRQYVRFKQIAMLFYYLQGLCTYATGRA